MKYKKDSFEIWFDEKFNKCYPEYKYRTKAKKRWLENHKRNIFMKILLED